MRCNAISLLQMLVLGLISLTTTRRLKCDQGKTFAKRNSAEHHTYVPALSTLTPFFFKPQVVKSRESQMTPPSDVVGVAQRTATTSGSYRLLAVVGGGVDVQAGLFRTLTYVSNPYKTKYNTCFLVPSLTIVPSPPPPQTAAGS